MANALSMQNLEAIEEDGVIMFSGFFTPLPVLGTNFDVLTVEGKLIRRYA